MISDPVKVSIAKGIRNAMIRKGVIGTVLTNAFLPNIRESEEQYTSSVDLTNSTRIYHQEVYTVENRNGRRPVFLMPASVDFPVHGFERKDGLADRFHPVDQGT